MNPLRTWATRPFASALAVALAVCLLLVSSAARAQAKPEVTAKALQKKAMEEDYLASEFTKAQDKLEKAAAQCGTDKCPAALRSRLKRDLGVVQIAGGLDREKGIANFVEAITIDPTITLDPDVKTKDLEQAFAEAKKRAGGGGTGGAAGGGGGQPQGDFDHTPAAAQQVRTPLPIYAEYSGGETLARVIARYKGFGMADWKPIELKQMSEKGWGGLVPCGDVQQGPMLYYFQGLNANNDPVATGGDRNSPYTVPITAEKAAEPPHLPGASPPTQCVEEGECPPNFPGCKKPGELKEGGEVCEEDTECKSNQCVDAKCTEYTPPEEKKKGARLWIGVYGALDFAIVPSADDVCKLKSDAYPLNDKNYYCVRDNGSDYPFRPPATGAKEENDAILPSGQRGSDKVAGGNALGNIRVMLGLDYAVSANVLLGARVGLVLNNYPGEAAGVDGKRFAAPVHLELRATYVVGKDALFQSGVAPYFFGGAGIARFETKIPVQVFETKPGLATTQRDADAWHIAGPAFVAIGTGLRLAVSSRFAFLLGVRGNLAFLNGFAPSFGPEIGGQLGF